MGVYFRGGSTIRDLLVHPKDKDTILQKSGVIYRYRCGRVDCEDEYIGDSGRTFGERFREHMRAPSPIIDHHNTTGHKVSLENFSIVGREDNSIVRNIKEAIFIRVNGPSLNRNVGNFLLPHIWDEVLARSQELNLKLMPITSGMVTPLNPLTNKGSTTSRTKTTMVPQHQEP